MLVLSAVALFVMLLLSLPVYPDQRVGISITSLFLRATAGTLAFYFFSTALFEVLAR